MDNSKEVWKDIQDYEGLYQVSNLGRVRNRSKKVMKQTVVRNGYKRISLYKNGKYNHLLVHRLVARAFLPNPDNLPQINHKDENPRNNSINNLEWCTSKYNINYGSRTKRMMSNPKYKHRMNHINIENIIKNNKKLYSKPVKQLTMDGQLIKVWPSTHEAGRHGFTHSSIVNCCNGKLNSHHGFRWEYLSK